MHEIVVNLHMHTRYSDGSGTHKDIAQAAMEADLDAVIVTDHNVLVQGVEGYYRSGPRRVLLLVGQEVHDQARVPQKNHLLIFNANRDVATFAPDPQPPARPGRASLQRRRYLLGSLGCDRLHRY